MLHSNQRFVALGDAALAAAAFSSMSMASAHETVQLLPPSTRPSPNRRASHAAALPPFTRISASSRSETPPSLPLLFPNDFSATAQTCTDARTAERSARVSTSIIFAGLHTHYRTSA